MCPLTSEFTLHGAIPNHYGWIFSEWFSRHWSLTYSLQSKPNKTGFCWISQEMGTFARLQLPVKVAFCETQEKSKVEDPWSCLLTIKTVLYSVLVAKKWLLKWDTCKRLHVVYPVLNQCLQKLIFLQHCHTGLLRNRKMKQSVQQLNKF